MILKNKHTVRTLWTLIVGLSACACSSDDLVAPGNGTSPGPDAQLVISLAVPSGNENEDDANGEDAVTRADMTPTETEGRISSIRLIAFGYDGGTAVVNRNLPVPSKMPVSPQKTAVYEVGDLAPGNYKVYMLANFGSFLDDVTSERDLERKIIDYTAKLPEAGSLPMVYEPSAMLSVGVAGEGEAAELECSMKIAAVKVKYNIIFDKTFNSDIFGDSGLRITGVTVRNVASSEYVVANTSDTDIATRSITADGKYFDAYTETQANASQNDADVITVSGAGAATPSDYTDKWVWQGTTYLPERYVAPDGVPTTMSIDAVVTDSRGADGNVRCHYEINLAAYDGAKDEKSMPRSTCYEVIGKVKTLGSAELDASISVKNWEETLISTDFIHTYLRLSKTSAGVTSLEEDVVTYQTDGRGSIEFECDRKFQGKNAILAAVSGSDHTIRFSVNPEVQVSQLSPEDQKGTARCYIKAGNIRKAIDVAYDITPFFMITPSAQKIQYDSSNPAGNVKEYSYRTNLGGVMITARDNKGTVFIGGSSAVRQTVSTVGSSRLNVSCTDPDAAMGTIVVTAQNDPGTTIIHPLDAYPKACAVSTTYDSMKQEIQCTVMKPLGSYRIYFRALNDWHKYDGGDGNISGEWLEGHNSMSSSLYPVEFSGTGNHNSNWIDYWCFSNNRNEASNSLYPHQASHRIYIWNQEGETTSSSVTSRVWRFTDTYDKAPEMKADDNSPGWYYYDLGYKASNIGWENGASGTRYTEPGTTLMIFHNSCNTGYGYTVHRASHHLDPGIPLFDFEDREGWIVYDPTCEPYYRIYDEKPQVEDIVYTIYSDVSPQGWYQTYGVAENNPAMSGTVKQWTIYSNNLDDLSTETIGGKKYYRYRIRMKAVRGDYEKAIKIKFGSGGDTPVPGSQRVYYCKRNGSGWDNPRVYVYKGNSGLTAWGSTPQMTLSHTDAEGTYYYYDIPSAYSNGNVIFQNNGRNEQYPAANQTGLALDGKTRIFYSDTKAWSDYTAPVSSPARGARTTRADNSGGYVLFGGRAFPGNTGYFNSTTKRWSAGKPN